MSNPNEPPLDEIQWRSPPIVASMGGLHSNTILFYFAESPFFERTSNNAVIMNQAMNNMAMYHYIQTREAFEARLKTMAGLEFIVGEEPAEMAPGTGTGVWVIRKQTRRKRYDDVDEVFVHASYFVVGENIYMAPNFSDILASRLVTSSPSYPFDRKLTIARQMTISSAIAKALPAAESVRKWRPSLGHVYQLPTNQISARRKPQSSKQTAASNPDEPAKTAAQQSDELSLERLAEESLMIHMKYGGEYIDENPITGRPGEFHLSSTGRKPVPPPQLSKADGIGPIGGPTLITTKLEDSKKDEKSPKTPRSAAPKPRRRKSKMSTSTPSAA